METINNITTQASKMIWGDQNPPQDNNPHANQTEGKEPISGQIGKGTADEPYDQGNSELPTSTTDKPTSTSATETPSSSEPTNTMSSNPAPTSTTGTNASVNAPGAATGGDSDPLKNTEKTGVTGNMGQSTHGSDVIPSESTNVGADPTSGSLPKEKQQGADRPHETPSSHEEGAVKEKKDEAEDVMAKRDPNDHSGEPMKMHDGSENKVPRTQEERRDSKAGQPGGQEHGKEHGTGEEWVKSTGIAAEGGDFDATKPGAGREATRLMEQKGIKTEGATFNPDENPSQAAHKDEKDKVPLGQKIKDKLHIGSHK